MRETYNLTSFEEFETRVKARQEKSIINKTAKAGRFTNFFTIPINIGIGATTGAWGFLIADLVSDQIFKEVQNQNNQRIENQERGRVRLSPRKSRITLTDELKTILKPPVKPILKKAA